MPTPGRVHRARPALPDLLGPMGRKPHGPA